MNNEKSEIDNSAYVPHPSVQVDEGLIDAHSDDDDDEEERNTDVEIPEKPNPMLVAGKKLIPPLASKFCSRRYTGKPLQEMDEFYRYKRVFLSFIIVFYLSCQNIWTWIKGRKKICGSRARRSYTPSESCSIHRSQMARVVKEAEVGERNSDGKDV